MYKLYNRRPQVSLPSAYFLIGARRLCVSHLRLQSSHATQTANDASNNLALLIDGDNVSYKHLHGIMLELPNYGRASVRRVYGDWTSPHLRAWKDYLLKYSITPIQQFAYTTGKNATDGAMIIDAMDLLHTRRFNSFCLVSSDSDFTRLTARIREQDITVYGIGQRQTTAAFVAACDKFVYFDTLQEEPAEMVLHEASASSPLPDNKTDSSPKAKSHSNASKKKRPELPLDQAAMDGITAAIQNCAADDENYVHLSEVAVYLSRYSPDLNYRNYHHDKLQDFVRASGLVDIKAVRNGRRFPYSIVALTESDSIGH